MSARPRLVQEGTPVTSSNEYGGYNDGYYEDDRQYYRGRGRYGGGRDYGYGGRGYGRGYGGRLHYRGYGGGRDYGYGGRGRYSSYYGGGFRGRGYGGRGRYYGGGRGRYHHGSSLQGRTNNFPPGPKTSISTRLVIGGGGEGAEEQQQTNGYDNYENLAYEHAQYADYSREAHMAKAKSSNIQTRLVIGEANDGEEQHHAGSMDIEEIIPSTYNEELHQIERMEGVESLEAKEPLIVMDGPNIAYAYADAMAGLEKSGDGKRQPDNRGLLVAANYFLEVGIRVLIVLPAPWFRAKPRPGDEDKGNPIMVTEQMEVLQELKEQGLLVAAPPRDDDDAYALTIGRREASRAREKNEGGGYVLSNDMFRDAMERDPNLSQWLKDEHGRISFAFCDMGSMDTYGDRVLDFIPNPRHPMVSEIESQVYEQEAYGQEGQEGA